MAAMLPVATPVPMATPPHMARVTVCVVTVDPALIHMSIPNDEPMLDDVEGRRRRHWRLDLHPGALLRLLPLGL
jgi:hypothetical protein